MNFHGDLAESWETPNSVTYVFHLRRGVRFHNGCPLTSADVKSTLDFIANPANRSPKRGALRLMSSVETLDAVAAVIHLSEP